MGNFFLCKLYLRNFWKRKDKDGLEKRTDKYWIDKSEWTPGDGDGQGGLACCDSWGRKELDMTERLNWTELNWKYWRCCSKKPIQDIDHTSL